MSNMTLKFQCKVTDLVNAMEKYGGVQNVVTANIDDTKGIINCLIGIIADVVVDNTKCRCSKILGVEDCSLEGETVLVKLKPEYEDYRNCFVACAKKLQELILSAEKEK